MYDKLDETGKVICQECGKRFMILTYKHLRLHGLSMNDYKRKYPGFPLSSKQFSAKQKFRKSKLFEKEYKEIEVKEEPDRFVIEEINISDQIKKKLDPNSTTISSKMDILIEIYEKFPNIQNNYVVEKRSPQGNLIYSIITDMADPVRRTVFEFPSMFWHNEDIISDSIKYKKLEDDGWRVIVIDKNKSLSEILENL